MNAEKLVRQIRKPELSQHDFELTEEEGFLAYADYLHDVLGQELSREPIDWEAEYLRLKKKEA